MAAMTSFQVEKCCHLVSEHEASAARLYSSLRQFLIYITFVFCLSILCFVSCYSFLQLYVVNEGAFVDEIMHKNCLLCELS